MVKVDVETLEQVRDALKRLEDFDSTLRPPDRRAYAALKALQAAEHRLANPLVQPSASGAAAAVEGLREAAGLSPRRDEPPGEMPRPVLPDEPPKGPGLPPRRR